MSLKLGFLAALFLLGTGPGYCQTPPTQPSPLEWTMINVNLTGKQGDAHLLTLPDKSHILIDTGDQGQWIIPYLKENKITEIDQLIISHPHHDHYGSIESILAEKIKIKKAYFNLPNETVCNNEKPWGCNYQLVQATIQALKNNKVSVLSAKAKDVLYHRNGVKLEVLYTFDGMHTPVGPTDINDTSLILLLTYGKTRVLFPGDLNSKIGTYLVQFAKKIHADILKVPHHGTEGVAPNEFFDAVNPKLALVPSPIDLWKSDRSKRIRNYFESKHIETYVNGRDGHVTVHFSKDGFTVSKSN